MENRKPFQLKNTLIAYNLFQVIFSTWLFYEVCYNVSSSSSSSHFEIWDWREAFFFIISTNFAHETNEIFLSRITPHTAERNENEIQVFQKSYTSPSFSERYVLYIYYFIYYCQWIEFKPVYFWTFRYVREKNLLIFLFFEFSKLLLIINNNNKKNLLKISEKKY